MSDFFVSRNGTMIMDEGLSRKLERILAEHPEKGDGTATAYEWSEMGLAELFGVLYESECRYCPERKAWYTYYDGAWRRDEGEMLVSGKIKEFSRLMVLYCVEIEDEELRSKYLKFIDRMGDRRMRDRVMKDARDVLPVSAALFDANPYLINCLNGTYDLRDFSFREHKWDDFLTMQTAFKHTVSREVRCERWEQFIDEVCSGDKNKADYLQRALGYSMLGLSNEECMFILWGKTTRNGKSTLLNTIETMLGDYAKVAPVGLICQEARAKDVESASPTLAGLKGKRFVTMAESNEYGKLDEEKIKQMTGGEEITARALYEGAVTFYPQFTLWLSCNDLPTVSDHSLFASERIRVIEFSRHFTAAEQDKKLKQELTAPDAMSGIFMWLVRGYKRYCDRGLEMNDQRMRQVVDQYERDNDFVQQFLEARCERVAGGADSVRAKSLYDSYKLWARSEGLRTVMSKKFFAELDRHVDWQDGKGMVNGSLVWYGLRLKV